MPTLRHMTLTAALLALGLLGALVASALGLPLPFLLGALLATSPLAIFGAKHLPRDYNFPPNFRLPFIALTGVAIGGQVTSELLSSLHDLVWSFGAIALFVVLAQFGNYALFRHLGGYDRPTAFFAGSPGGLLESILLGEAAGANAPTLMAQQFLRIILVIVLVPLGLSFWLGEAVGSAAGLSFSDAPVTAASYPLALVALSIGLALGRALRLPAWQLTGPIAVSTAIGLAGLPIALPSWAIVTAQLVIGASLGMRFAGLALVTLRRCLWLSALSVGFMFALGATLALLLMGVTGEPFDVLLITFAPGGVTEMALVALSLGANPAFVSLHHIFRIVITVLLMGLVGRRLPPAD